MIQKYFDILSKDQLNKLWDHLNQPKWKFCHRSHRQSNAYFWKMDLNDYDFFKLEVFDSIKNFIGNDFTIDKVYANGQTFGLDGDFHIDSEDPNTFTFLYYPMARWDLTWGGETIIINPNTKEINYFHPIPNGGLLFPGNWTHCGKGPSKIYSDLRVSIAYKIIRVNENFKN